MVKSVEHIHILEFLIYLDNDIIYRDGTNKRIDCYERVPFANYQVEDYIEIDLDV
jgi:hypothetical protein